MPDQARTGNVRLLPGRCRVFALVACFLVAACGGDEPKRAVQPSSTGPTLPTLPSVSDDEIAARALEHVLRGPGRDLLTMGMARDANGQPVGFGGIWDGAVHGLSAELARKDLLALPEATLRALAAPGLVERLTNVHPNNEEPWLVVLDLLARMPNVPYEALIPWVQPVLDGRASRYLPGPAIRLLAASRDDRARSALRTYVGDHATSVDVLEAATRPLLRGEPDDRALALRVLLRHGTGQAWIRVSSHLLADLPSGQIDLDRMDALAWWSVMAEGSGPTLPTERPRVKRCVPGALGVELDDRTLPAVAGRAVGLRPAPKDGWVHTQGVRDLVVPLMAYLFTGDEPAAEARCDMARRERGPWAATIKRDMALHEVDPARALRAKHCMLPELAGDVRAEAVGTLEAWLANPAGPTDVGLLSRAMAGLPDPALDKASHAVLLRVLAALPPGDLGLAIAQLVQDRVGPDDDGLVEFVVHLLLAGDEVQQQVARTLMLRRPDARYVPAIEKHLASLPPEEARSVWRRALVLVAQIPDLPAPVRTRWVDELVRRVAEATPEQGALLVGALLDFGELGAGRFAAGLRGPLRSRYMAGWPVGTEHVPQQVAEALVGPIGPTTDASELYAALQAAWRTFPPTAAPALAALAQRVDPPYRSEVQPVLDRVRLRAMR